MSSSGARRDFLIRIGSLMAAACASREDSVVRGPVRPGGPDPFARIEASIGGRVGVFAIDTGSGRALGHREGERFAMCSTFKWVLAAAALMRIDRGELRLDERIPYGRSDLVAHAPVTEAHVAEGSMAIEALAEAAITESDNTAANLLLSKIDGPAGFTRFVRQLGDPVTRLDREEPALNSNVRGDPRDTTSPRAMARLARVLACGETLSGSNRDRLNGWMAACKTGHDRLRAGLPQGWSVGDKTGTGSEGAVNGVAIAVPPGRAPIVIAAYLSESTSPLVALNAAHAEIGRIVSFDGRGP